MAHIKIEEHGDGLEVSIQGSMPELMNILANAVERSQALSVVVLAVASLITDEKTSSAAQAALDMCANKEPDSSGISNLWLILQNSRKNNSTNE